MKFTTYPITYLLLTIMVICTISLIGITAVSAEEISILIDDREIDFPDQGPYFDGSNRVQVPVRFVSEELGGYVEWDSHAEQVNITQGETELELNIGSDQYQIGENSKKMDTVPQISNEGRTMVPLRFVSEGLGAYVEWDGNTNTVNITSPDDPEQDDRQENSRSGDDENNVTDYSDNHIEVHASALNVRVKPSINAETIHQIEAGETYRALDVTRDEDAEEYRDWVKIDLSDSGSTDATVGWVSADYVDIHEDDMDVDIPDEVREEEEQEKREEREQARQETQQLWKNILSEDYTGAMGELTVDADNLNVRKGPGLDYERITQVNTGEHYLMLSEASMGNHLDYEDWFKIKLDDDKKGWIAAEFVKEDEIVYQNDLGNIDFIEWEDNDRNTEVRIGPVKRVPLDSFTREDPERLVIDLDRIGLATSITEWEVGTSTIEKIRAHEHQNSNFSRVVFDINNKQHYSLEWDDSHLVVRIFDDDPLAGTSIFLDPGHGGSDNGAEGSNGLKEKDVVLDVSLMTKDILEGLGAEVIMSRKTDTTVGLDERVEMSNDSNADLFVSVHANAHPDSSIQGTETFYSSERSALDFELAEALQDSLLQSLGRNNRGVKDSRFRVLRNNTIPAALVELAFLSNREEEALLRSDEFRKNSAEGIVEGILNYDKLVN